VTDSTARQAAEGPGEIASPAELAAQAKAYQAAAAM
jgi:hypothetical protein